MDWHSLGPHSLDTLSCFLHPSSRESDGDKVALDRITVVSGASSSVLATALQDLLANDSLAATTGFLVRDANKYAAFSVGIAFGTDES